MILENTHFDALGDTIKCQNLSRGYSQMAWHFEEFRPIVCSIREHFPTTKATTTTTTKSTGDLSIFIATCQCLNELN
jgi:hypothetical protein